MVSDVLIYTVAIDEDGQSTYKMLAKLLVSSILRSGFNGRIVVFHNSPTPMFPVGRARVHEEQVDLPAPPEGAGTSRLEPRWSLKHQVAGILHEEYQWQRLLFIDADCLVTGSLSYLTEGDWQIAVCKEPGQQITLPQFACFLADSEMETLKIEGINSGVFCLDRSVSESFFEQWAKAEQMSPTRYRCCLDQAAFNRVILDHDYQLHDIGRLVSMPFHTGKVEGAILTHWVGTPGFKKLQPSYGLFMETYFFDPALTLFNLLES